MTPRTINIGHRVFIGPNVRIEGVEKYGVKSYTPEIILEDGVSIQQNAHVTCANCIRVGKNTAIAANVTITDIVHPYEDVTMPIESQELRVSQVQIGPDCKIYNNAVILPSVTIGKHCVIGANSVVTKDIPDYCVAVGAPAKIVKKYNFQTNNWERV